MPWCLGLKQNGYDASRRQMSSNMITSTSEIGKLSQWRVRRWKSFLAKAKTESVCTEAAGEPHLACLAASEIDQQRLTVRAAPEVVSAGACAHKGADTGAHKGAHTDSCANSTHKGTVLILTNDPKMRMRLLFLITAKMFSCLVVNSLEEAQAIMEKEPLSAVLLDVENESLEFVATQLSHKHQVPIIVRSSRASGPGFAIPFLAHWLSRTGSGVELLETLFMQVKFA